MTGTSLAAWGKDILRVDSWVEATVFHGVLNDLKGTCGLPLASIGEILRRKHSMLASGILSLNSLVSLELCPGNCTDVLRGGHCWLQGRSFS